MKGNQGKQRMIRRNSIFSWGLCHKNLLVCIMLGMMTIGFCSLFVLRYGVFGSRVDWINQHSVFPEYFRRRFYETRDLLPDFAWNLGAGQNIYTMSYYGLFSPVILLSYLLPFVRMDIYIMVSSIVSYGASVLLLFLWLQSHHFHRRLSVTLTILFSLTTAFLYQSYNQIMFVNYMPFLCMALWGTDRYLLSGKRGWLIFGTWGMIMTSFYFSIGGMSALCLYALSAYSIQISGQQVRGGFGSSFLCAGVRYVGQIFLAILLSGILLLPTAMVIFGGERTQTDSMHQNVSLVAFEPLKILYYPYGVGASVLVILAVIGGIFYAKKWTERILPVGLLLVFSLPMVGVLLNGGLYEKYKVFIPFLPLLILQCAYFLQTSILRNRQDSVRDRLWQLLPWMILLLLLGLGWKELNEYRVLAQIDWLLTGITFFFARRKKHPSWVVLPGILCLFILQLGMHPKADRMLHREEYATLRDEQIEQQIQQIGQKDSDWYRMEVFQDDYSNHNSINRIVSMQQNVTSLYSSCYHSKYADFRKQIFHINEPFRNTMMQSVTDNPCFLQFMGVKYQITNSCLDNQGFTELKNEKAAPLWYVTDQVISQTEYLQCGFPTCQTMLLQRSVVEDQDLVKQNRQMLDTGMEDLPKMVQQPMTLPEMETEDLSIYAESEGKYRIVADQETTISVPYQRQNANQNLLAVSFIVENLHPNRDIWIRIQRQTNKLSAQNHEYANHNQSFYYLMPYGASERGGEKTVDITFSKGEYTVRNWHTYGGCLDALQNMSLYHNPVQTDPDFPKGDMLSGHVVCDQAGYLITSIPYDDHFQLWVDGEEIDPICVNMAFLGARIEAGEHILRLEYHAPGKRAGICMSLLGLLGLLCTEGIVWIRKQEKKGI